MMALKRVMEPSGGRILIDGVDIAAVPLFDLRSRLALVPQVRQGESQGDGHLCHANNPRSRRHGLRSIC